MSAGSAMFVYLLFAKSYGTLNVGMTCVLARRVWEHKNNTVPGFARQYGVDRSFWFEVECACLDYLGAGRNS
jgi:putative endonuclease